LIDRPRKTQVETCPYNLRIRNFLLTKRKKRKKFSPQHAYKENNHLLPKPGKLGRRQQRVKKTHTICSDLCLFKCKEVLYPFFFFWIIPKETSNNQVGIKANPRGWKGHFTAHLSPSPPTRTPEVSFTIIYNATTDLYIYSPQI